MTAQITLTGPLAETLETLAKEQNQTVEAIIENLLATTPTPRGTLAQLAASAREADIHTGATDTAENSRDILRNEFADYLKRHDAD